MKPRRKMTSRSELPTVQEVYERNIKRAVQHFERMLRRTIILNEEKGTISLVRRECPIHGSHFAVFGCEVFEIVKKEGQPPKVGFVAMIGDDDECKDAEELLGGDMRSERTYVPEPH